MYHSAFQLNQEFLATLCARIHALRSRYTDDINFAGLFAKPSLIVNEQLAKIIDTAYWASQAIEEGNQVKISIVFIEREPSGRRQPPRMRVSCIFDPR